MNTKYDHPYAHELRPVKGWDSMAHLDFTAPIATGVENLNAGTVMHLNSTGSLETGIGAQDVALFLFYKQNDEDTLNYPTTADGTRLTSISMNSFGGYNSEQFLRGTERFGGTGTWDARNGGASNLPGFDAATHTVSGSTITSSYGYTPAKSAHLTYPCLCNMEFASTEFAETKYVTGDDAGYASTASEYAPNTYLTSPIKNTAATSTTEGYGTQDQKLVGGFLMPATPYIDGVCGVVSRGMVQNEHGYNMIFFWGYHLPAITATKPENNKTLKTSTSGAVTPTWA